MVGWVVLLYGVDLWSEERGAKDGYAFIVYRFWGFAFVGWRGEECSSWERMRTEC